MRLSLRRVSTTVAAAVVVALIGGAGGAAPTRAQTGDEPPAGDLSAYLERAAEADYAGRRIVVTTWDGESEFGVVDVEHLGSMTRIAGSLMGEGKVSSGDAPGIALESWSGPLAVDRYTTTPARDVLRLGRPARLVSVFEGDTVRARFAFDVETWAPLTTEIFDDAGELFRFAAFTEFAPDLDADVYEELQTEGRAYDLMENVAASDLPDEAGGYRRLDVYGADDGVIQAFYGDGLFSFSVFALGGDGDVVSPEGGRPLEIGDDTYLVTVNATDLWVQWQSGEGDYLLVGDLPPDHLERVLATMPGPSSSGLLSRVWDRLFG
jgi:hypothetical protein